MFMTCASKGRMRCATRKQTAVLQEFAEKTVMINLLQIGLTIQTNNGWAIIVDKQRDREVRINASDHNVTNLAVLVENAYGFLPPVIDAPIVF